MFGFDQSVADSKPSPPLVINQSEFKIPETFPVAAGPPIELLS